MKRLLLFVLFIPVFAWAQENSMFYPLVKDATYKLTSVNKKGKPTGSEIHKILSVESVGGGTRATIECTTFDPKNRAQTIFTYDVEVTNDVTKIDWRARLNGIQNAIPAPLMKEAYPCYLELPNNPQVGQTLRDCTVAYEKGRAQYAAQFYDIQIIGKETITIGGTSYEAYILQYGFLTHIKEGLDIKFNKYHKDWYVPGKGMVKSTCSNSSKEPKPTDEMNFFTELQQN